MNHRQGGFSLVELIVSIVVIGVAVGGVLLVFGVALTHSADPMQQQQAVAIAEGYLDEILARAYSDPDGIEPEAGRAVFDDVGDYNGLDESPHDQDNQPLDGLGDYHVHVTVTDEMLGPSGAQVSARRVDVQVTRLPLIDLTMTGYRVTGSP